MTDYVDSSKDIVEPSRDTESQNSGLPKFQVTRLEQFDKIHKACRDLFTEKNVEYRDSIAECGVLGAVASFNGISARLRHLVIQSTDAGESKVALIAELAKDAHIYADIILMLVADDNWKGK